MPYNIIDKYWYHRHPIRWLIWPLSLIFNLLSGFRRFILKRFIQKRFNTPVIVIGNITVGGVGKTPLVIALCQKLKSKGYKVAVVSRGYGSQTRQYPYEISSKDNAYEVGDEPLLIFEKTTCPVVISPNRSEAVNYIERKYRPDFIVSDDGLQHYAMARDIEIVVIDGTRELGNEMLLPAGPLRESKSRLDSVDFVVVNEGTFPGAYSMRLCPNRLIKLSTKEHYDIEELDDSSISAIAAIGNPNRFFNALKKRGLVFTSHVFPDHYQFKQEDLVNKGTSIIMTEKDAVKCRQFNNENLYFLPVTAELADNFWQDFFKHKIFKGK